MKKGVKNILILCLVAAAAISGSTAADTVLESFTYCEDFETRELSAWASYPLWQDTAYDPHFHIGAIVPGDPNISMIQKVTPYTNVDNYAGGLKELDMYMTSGSTITLRYYLKTNLPVEYFKVRIAAGPDGKADCTVSNPERNRWVWITVSYDDFIRENIRLAGKQQIKVNALAVLAKIPSADPSMSIYLGLDDIEFKGQRAAAFQFVTPEVFKLSEWKPYIAKKHYHRSETFTLRGTWPVGADRVTIEAASYTERADKLYQGRLYGDADSAESSADPEKYGIVYNGTLKKTGDTWSLPDMKLTWDEGLYLATLTAYKGNKKLTETFFTFYIAPENIGGRHPRLWFDAEKKKWVEDRIGSDKFKTVGEGIINRAKNVRDNNPVDSIVFEVDQFHTHLHAGNSLPSIYPWFTRVNMWRSGVYNSGLAYGLLGDREAGEYGVQLMLKLSEFPYWLHPWFIERGRHIYYPIGELGMEMAVAYDLLYDLMDEKERRQVRAALMKNVVLGCHKGYVEDDIVTSNTSNWVAHVTGGSLMCQAAMYGDGPDVEQMEPYFTGAIMKDHELIHNALDRDGAYGEGYGYYNFSMFSWSMTLPAMNTVFKIDMSSKLNGSYKELIWAGNMEEKETYYFGDSRGSLNALTNWAWLLDLYKDPQLGWFYNHLKGGETLMDVLYETSDVPQQNPFGENPVKLFRDVGTTVFKSGWSPDDFIFVMRTGPFVNHQHLDQGSFWLSDCGSLFIEERHNSTYYDDPLYQSWYTQPVAHSTILIDGNHQSQRVGDLLWHVDGFDDYAYVSHFLDGHSTAFSSGDIGRLYWGEVKELTRNVLYIKPRTLLMLDTVTPVQRDIDVTLLYQTLHLKDIEAGDDVSTITKDGNTLFIHHLYPKNIGGKAVETPHYLNTLNNEKPLEREGMLMVTARTSLRPLVIANLLATSKGVEPHITEPEGDGFIAGKVGEVSFSFSTHPGQVYTVGDIETDACAVTWDGAGIFAAKCTSLKRGGTLFLETKEPLTCEFGTNSMKYYAPKACKIVVGSPAKPNTMTVNGKKEAGFSYDAGRKAIVIAVPAGEGVLGF